MKTRKKMSKPAPIIKWEKWRDPLKGSDDNEIDVEYHNHQTAVNEANAVPENIQLAQNIRVIQTPLGIIPFNEFTASSKIFNFWTIHTNFDISENVANIIEKVEGVEALNIFTRYRLRIAIGKAFDEVSVKKNLETSVYKHIKVSNDRSRVPTT